jgi:hypothetical protein
MQNRSHPVEIASINRTRLLTAPESAALSTHDFKVYCEGYALPERGHTYPIPTAPCLA